MKFSLWLWLKLLCGVSHPVTGGAALQELHWLQGSWIQATATDTLIEQWNIHNDSLIGGVDFIVHQGQMQIITLLPTKRTNS